MEDKQLDFNRPLLSVRRFSSTAAPSETEVKKKPEKSFPKIPPLPVYKSDLKSGPIRNPGTVPFLWEQTPGRPKDVGKSRSQSIEKPPFAPKLPPGRVSNIKHQTLEKGSEDRRNSRFSSAGNVFSSSPSASCSEKNTTKCESSVEGESSSCEDVNEAYVDALDTLSWTESVFLNCSLSGVSGLDDSEVKPSGTFSTDQWTRDFMMGRFLPAAKAIASEAPQHTNRKQLMAQEQPRNIQTVNMDRQPLPRQCSPNNFLYQTHDKKWEASDDEDDDYGPGNSSATICGLLPRFCMKSPLSLLNTVPGMQLKAQEAIKLRHRASARGSYASFYSEVPEKAKKFQMNEPDPERKGCKNFRELLTDESSYCLAGSASPVEKTLYIDSVHKVKSPKSNSNSSDAKRLNDVQGDDLDALLKSREIEAPHSMDSSLQYIKVSNVMGERAISKPRSLESVDSIFLSSPEKSPHVLEIDAKGSSCEDQGIGKNSTILSSPDMDVGGKIDLESNLHKKLSNQEKLLGHILKTVSSSSSKTAADGRTDLKCKPQMSLSSQEESAGNYSQFPLSLPPPKSPSDSWLKRTLPSVSVKNSSPWSCIGANNCTKTLGSNTASVDPKQETVVETSNLQHRHLYFSEERLAPIPEA